MTKTALNHFRIDNKFYIQYIDFDTDATSLEESGEVLYTVNSDAVLYDRAGQLGKFRTDEDNFWYFECLSGLVVVTNNKDLIKAEMKVFKHFLGS